MCVYIYIYIQRERERKKETKLPVIANTASKPLVYLINTEDYAF